MSYKITSHNIFDKNLQLISYAPKNTNPPMLIHVTRGVTPANNRRIPPSVYTRYNVFITPLYGIPFLSYQEVSEQLAQERQRSEQEYQRAENAQQRLAEMETVLQQYRDRFGDLPSE